MNLTKSLLLLYIVTFSVLVKAQVIVDSTKSASTTLIYYGGINYQGENVAILTDRIFSQLNFYDDSLRLMRSVPAPVNGPDTALMEIVFEFNNELYVQSQTYTHGKWVNFYYKYSNGTLQYVSPNPLDTLSNTIIVHYEEVNSNTLRLQAVKKSSYNYPYSNLSLIIELDSNLQLKHYQKFYFDTILGFIEPTILHYRQVNDSIAHLFLPDAIVHYNLKQQQANTAFYLRGKIVESYTLNSNEYLALGETVRPEPGLDSTTRYPIYGSEAMGFYRMTSSGFPLDSIFIFHKTDSSFGAFITSVVNTSLTGVQVIDSNNMYLTAEVDFQPLFGGSEYGLWVIKIDRQYNEIWRFELLSKKRVYKVLSADATPDGGLVLFGYYFYSGQQTVALRLKLGPNGTLTDVEVQAPEDFVQFYPNPVKDVLRYNYLPPAKGNYTLEVHNMSGQKVGSYKIETDNSSISVNLKSDFYLYDLLDDNGKTVQVGKIVVE
tara:strand:- start:409 stop:1875 length:1467 start_codon:yes stop_codon:yes gene_type:complete